MTPFNMFARLAKTLEIALSGKYSKNSNDANLANYLLGIKISNNIRETVKNFFLEEEKKRKVASANTLVLICFSCQIEIGERETRCPSCHGSEFTSTVVRSNRPEPSLLGM